MDRRNQSSKEREQSKRKPECLGGWVGGGGGQLKPQFHRVTFSYVLFRLMVRRGVNQHRKNNKICDMTVSFQEEV